MAIQTTAGPFVVDNDDLKFTYAGKTIAVKIRVVSWPVVAGLIKQADGSWKQEVDLTGDLFSTDPPNGGDVVGGWVNKIAGGNMTEFIRQIILPRLNDWLKTVFKPTVTTTPPSTTPIQTLQTTLGGIRFVVQADGSVKAEL